MWKLFAILYSVLLVISVLLIGFLILSGAIPASTFRGALLGVISIMAVLTNIGLIAYAFGLNVPPLAIWRPFSWLLGAWQVVFSLLSITRSVSVITALPTGSYIGVSTILWLVLSLLINYFSWLAVWRYGQRVSRQPARAR